jgi:hypothetical protein
MSKTRSEHKVVQRETQKTEKEVKVDSEIPKGPVYVTFEIPEPDEHTRRVTKRTMETRRTETRTSETQVIILEGTSDDSDAAYFKKSVSIKKLLPPTPEKLIIDGELYPQKPRKSKRVRVRKHKPKRSNYKPVPYVSGPTTYWVPDRKDVLMAAEQWSR